MVQRILNLQPPAPRQRPPDRLSALRRHTAREMQRHIHGIVFQFLYHRHHQPVSGFVHTGHHIHGRHLVKMQEGREGIVLRLLRRDNPTEKPLMFGCKGRTIHCHPQYAPAIVRIPHQFLGIPDRLPHHPVPIGQDRGTHVHRLGNIRQGHRPRIAEHDLHQRGQRNRIHVVVDFFQILLRIVRGPVPDIPFVQRNAGPARDHRWRAQFPVRTRVHAQGRIAGFVDGLVQRVDHLLEHQVRGHAVLENRTPEVIMNRDHVGQSNGPEQYRPVPFRTWTAQPADHHLDRGIHPLHLHNGFPAPGGIRFSRLLACLPVPVDLVAQ